MKFHDILPAFINLEGSPINVKDYKLFAPFFNSKARHKVLLTGRQIGKSVSVIAKQLVKGCLKKHSSFLTGHPLHMHTYRFSRLVDTVIDESAALKEFFKKTINRVDYKETVTKTRYYFCPIGDSADRVRGATAKDIFYDEAQDICRNSIEVASQCAKHFPDSTFTFTGTAKSKNNNLTVVWEDSSMNEATIRCSRCRNENLAVIPDVYKMMSKEGLRCQRCAQLLDLKDVINAYYTPTFPDKQEFNLGLHIPQIFIAHSLHPGLWEIIWKDYKGSSPKDFANEVLGIPFDVSGSPVSLDKLKKCCTQRKMGEVGHGLYSHVFMGIDWGYATSRSQTAVAIVGNNLKTGKYDLLYAMKYDYNDRLDQIRQFCKLFKSYNCTAVGCDAGVGCTDNLILRDTLGFEQVYEYLYVNSTRILKFDDVTAKFIANRTVTMGLTFQDLNKELISFPKYEEMELYFKDILGIVEEERKVVGGSSKYYDHHRDNPDDFFHALNYAMMTSKLVVTGSLLSDISLDTD